MKYLPLLVFFFLFNSGHAQEYSFQLYSKNPCNDKEAIDTSSYSIRKVVNFWKSPPEIDHFYDYLKSKGQTTINLPSPGTYIIESKYQFPPVIDTVEIRQPGLYKHKRNESKITQKVYGPGYDYTYAVCGELAQGYAEDHYKNGNLLIKGNFINGEATEITYYYYNGKIKEELKHRGKIYCGKSHDSLGRQSCKFKSSYIKGSYSYNRSVTYFYPNGKIATKYKDNGIWRVKLYYPNGKPELKISSNKRIDYFENGAKKYVYTWEIKKTHWEFIDAGYGSPLIVEKAYGDAYVVTCKEYDLKGKLLSTTTEVDPGIHDKQPQICKTGLPDFYKTPLIYNYLL